MPPWHQQLNLDRTTKDQQLILAQVSAIRHNNGIFCLGESHDGCTAIPRAIGPRGIPVKLNLHEVRLSVPYET